ncbi:MAG: PIN domain-containing protein [Nostoc sp.]|uniref:PIN domain-containing protein n=1 Tax=Nostoc sp. TaxID=1180 RepID=UPI002FFB2595
MIEAKLIELVSFSVLEYENSRNPFPINQQSMAQYIQIATLRVLLDENIRVRAKQLEQQGIKAIDALHVASAEASKSDYFITCDKKINQSLSRFNTQSIQPD